MTSVVLFEAASICDYLRVIYHIVRSSLFRETRFDTKYFFLRYDKCRVVRSLLCLRLHIFYHIISYHLSYKVFFAKFVFYEYGLYFEVLTGSIFL